MYDDDGENKNAIAQNQFELIKFATTGTTNKGIVITAQSNNGVYKNKPSERNISLTIPTMDIKPKAVLVNNVVIKNFTISNEILTVPFTLKAVPVRIEVKW